jgi:hypothetical protein
MNRNHINRKCFVFCCLIIFSQILIAQVKSEKRGIAYGHHSESDLEVISRGLSWWYNWYVEPESGVKETFQNYEMDFVPMVWGAGADTSILRKFLKSHPGVKYILGFNEPNFKSQANMTPVQAAENWPKIEELANEFNLKIVGPAVNYCGDCVDIPGTNSDSDPVEYLDAFFDACPECRVDYIGVHNYMCYAGPIADYIGRFKKYDKKIWLTEFACWDQSTITPDMQKSLVIGAIDYLENDTNVFRYSWFSGDRTGKWPYLDIFGPKPGALTELGELYVNFYPIHDQNVYFNIPARIEAESYSAMSGIALEGTSDYDGIANVGWFDGGDWLQFNVNVPETGEYYLYLRISSNANTSVIIKENGLTLSTVTIPTSGGWQNWKNISKPIALSQGKHKLQFYSATGQFNINWIAFTTGSNTSPTVITIDEVLVTLPESSILLTSTGNDKDGNNLTYKWNQVNGLKNCSIQTPNEASTEITGLTEGNYSFKVTVSDGIETASALVNVKVNHETGIDFEKAENFRVYPNPMKDILNVKLNSSDENGQLVIYSTDGKILLTEKIEAGEKEKNFDLEKLKSGVYFIQIGNSKMNEQQMIVKQ